MSNALARIEPNIETMNVLAPQSSVNGRITPMHTIMWTLVKVDPNNETYDIQGGGKGMHKSAIGKIATAAGIRVTSSQPIEIPGMTGPDCLVWQVKGEMDLGGELPVTAVGTKMWTRNVGKDGKDTEHFLSKTETKAMLRMVRALLGIQSKYNKADFDKPFAVPHIVYSPDYSDPNVREVVTARNAGNVAALYGASDQNALPPLGNDFDAAEDEDVIIDGDYTVDEGREVNTATGEFTEAPESAESAESVAARTFVCEPEHIAPAAPKFSDVERAEFAELMAYVLPASDQKGKTLKEVLASEGAKWFQSAADFFKDKRGTLNDPAMIAMLETLTTFNDFLKRSGQ